MPNPLSFKISSALKDIIGRDLITDDFIAVFELVKNSFDAHANKVDIYFDGLYTGKPSITIIDNGKGMNRNDLENKWLFVAYSAKKDGTEDLDYRDNIYSNRPFAGAKGIGRFSCDRLGAYLHLETIKKESKPKVEVLKTNWEKFEEDIQNEFVNITVTHETKSKSEFGLIHGTALQITELRSTWDRSKLLKLKDSLAKLINPNRGKGEQRFKIVIHALEEEEQDKLEDQYYNKVTGEVQNFIFETLGLKTTKIQASISTKSKRGSYITTTLHDGGTLIYKIKEKNPFNLLWDIDITLYYLNKSAKLTFAKRMGLASRLYGHVFLYKNGFRVYPYGEPYEDPLKIDVRKSRKQYSYLGTGELIGQIEIFGDNPEFKETSSRGDGLIKNRAYFALEDYFWLILERLEKYVVEVQQWGLSIEDSNNSGIKSAITDLIAQLTGSEEILEFEYTENFLELIQESQSESAGALINNLNKIAVRSKDDDLMKVAKEAAIKFEQVQKARIDAEREAAEAKMQASKARKELEERVSENLFLKSIRSQELEDVLNLMHHIGISTSTIQNYLKGVVYRLDKNTNISKSDLRKVIANINSEVNKIYSISRFATRANFKVSATATKINIVEFISEYLINVVKPFLNSVNLFIDSGNKKLKPFLFEFRPLELIIVLDNLISNSRKAKATNIVVRFQLFNDNSLVIYFEDDGIGVTKEDRDRIFDYGFTRTDGSGLGLFHVKEIIERHKGTIRLNKEVKEGAQFIITLNK